ncbi:hypothetical protein [Beggiatoa leptomitoformis]|uniref:Uncharacterized protein n=1 Tax=Beggiatoa leptomitoformis TaxID=288004 RepID=A0A2N9YFX2_9GAMM|nr:hypothetical protein [Beggiatoa leptomitoformis]ALG68233.1 hypothetical protein AL038_11580 [Beggiatoa leptomitoformis]AUI69461.1 hypothetical protein BLE401_12695 [Beggiatoa leptomitoformis]
MASKEEINSAIKNKGMTQGSWARVKGFNESNVRNFIARYADKEIKPRSISYAQIDEAFKADFGFSIRKDHEND